MTDRNIPLSGGEFAALTAPFGPFESAPHIAVAVSGGGDSLALLLLADEWARALGGRATALSVDHGLRAGSADELSKLNGWLEGLAIEHRILTWTGAKHATGIQAAARDARYALMSAWCREKGVLHLFIAHTLEDQAETFLMRLARGSGVNGLAAMPGVTERFGLRLLRPLLSVPKARLRALLGARGQDWIEDPSNRDNAYERVRVRRLMPDLAAVGLDAEALSATVARMAGARMALEGAACELIARSAFFHPAGFVRLDRNAIIAAPGEVALHVLGRVLMVAGGGNHKPRRRKLKRLWAALGRKDISLTLGGCRVEEHSGGALLVCREARNLPEISDIQPGRRVIWDNRFEAFVGAGHSPTASPLSLAALGESGWAEVVGNAPEVRQSPVPRAVRAGLPAFRDDAGILAAPHLGYRRAGAAFAGGAHVRFFPRNSAAGTGFCVA
ncbi:MAG TPA: tRNA lysidine(34) synthetase TilS [Alphaproteobacteria bacterium]|nr:tRNA lysidine(34) synthetase TilS [Alphaproteobacteria bacterium]